MPSRVVLIHFGAHRTGTTYLQHVFSTNREVLAGRNIRYVSIHESPPVRLAFLRARYALRDGDPDNFSHNFEIVAAFLKQHLNDHDGDLLISYEGFLGDLSLRCSTEIYPHHAILLERLMSIFEGERVHGAFAIREYGAFVESGYKYLAQTGLRESFRRYMDWIDLDALSWLPIVSALTTTFGQDLSLWRYEDFEHAQRDVIKWLFQRAFGIRAYFLVQPGEPSNASVSRTALPALLLVNRLSRSHRRASNGIYKMLLRCLPASKFGKARLFNDRARDRLRRRYARDIETIRAEVPQFYSLPLEATAKADGDKGATQLGLHARPA
jgi:hypothetical protein